MRDINFNKVINDLHNKDFINKHELNVQASSEYYEKKDISDKFSLGIAGATISSGFSLLMINKNSELGQSIGKIFKAGAEKLIDVCSGYPILENMIHNFQEPSISGSVLVALGLTGITKYAIELKYDDKLREKHNQNFIGKKVEEIIGESITSFIGTKKDLSVTPKTRTTFKNT